MSALQLMLAACIGPMAAALANERQLELLCQHCCRWADASSSDNHRALAEGSDVLLLHQSSLAGARAILGGGEREGISGWARRYVGPQRGVELGCGLSSHPQAVQPQFKTSCLFGAAPAKQQTTTIIVCHHS